MSGSFFPYLSLAEEYFKAHGQRATYKKRQLLVRHDEPSQWIFFLRSGLIKVAYTLDDGTERLMGYFIPGMVFAQLGAFFPDSLNGMEYEAALNTNVYRLPRQQFLDALSSSVEMSQEYLDAMIRNQIFMIERLEYQGEKGMRQKYLKWLLFVMR
ncbi:Crp/Fnr family transcriptional regulator, partial [Candidatus Saccharibacteria bacterium]|nr:Crp/Fnr family transcriptional regulator [Candidatus Saccharibacteria bacterium]